MDFYRKGRICEGKVIRQMRESGFENIRQSAGSRGPADVYAIKDGRKYYVQVKTGAARASHDEVERLKKMARQRHGVVAVVHRENVKNHWWLLGNWSGR